MKIVRSLIFVFIALLVFSDTQAQVSQKIIVEHFTNTRCILCSQRSPGFYNVYNNNPGILHISYHPSSPYTSCFLNQHNKAENDGRTRYYNIYGSTPKFVIQGKLNNRYSQDNVYEPYQNKQSDISIALEQYLNEDGKINATVSINNETGANLNNAALFIGLAEAVVNYDAPNGEDVHLDVFRKAFTAAAGEIIDLNEKTSIAYQIDVNKEWDLKQLYVYAIVQNAESKTVIQSEALAAGIEQMIVGIDDFQFETTAFYPNPASTFMYSSINFNDLTVYNNNGQIVFSLNAISTNKLDVSNLEKGLYFIKATSKDDNIVVQKFLKE